MQRAVPAIDGLRKRILLIVCRNHMQVEAIVRSRRRWGAGALRMSGARTANRRLLGCVLAPVLLLGCWSALGHPLDHWTSRQSGVASSIACIAHASGQFIAAGAIGSTV